MLNKKRLYKVSLAAVMMVSCMVVTNASLRLNTQKHTLTRMKVEDSDIGSENTMDKIYYFGKWAAGASADCSGGYEHYTNKNIWGSDSEAPGYSVKFKGVGIALYGNKSAVIGKSDVYIDNEYVGSYDGESAARITQQLLYQIESLENTEHVIRVVNKKSGGTQNGMHVDYVKIIKKDEVTEQPLTISHEQLYLNVGDSESITVTQNEDIDSDILWESSDPDIILVKNGVVTAVHQGSAVIRITSEMKNITYEIPVQVSTVD